MPNLNFSRFMKLVLAAILKPVNQITHFLDTNGRSFDSLSNEQYISFTICYRFKVTIKKQFTKYESRAITQKRQVLRFRN